MDHMAKLYETILERKLRSKIEPRLGEEQYGYRGGRSTTDLMFALIKNDTGKDMGIQYEGIYRLHRLEESI